MTKAICQGTPIEFWFFWNTNNNNKNNNNDIMTWWKWKSLIYMPPTCECCVVNSIRFNNFSFRIISLLVDNEEFEVCKLFFIL